MHDKTIGLLATIPTANIVSLPVVLDLKPFTFVQWSTCVVIDAWLISLKRYPIEIFFQMGRTVFSNRLPEVVYDFFIGWLEFTFECSADGSQDMVRFNQAKICSNRPCRQGHTVTHQSRVNLNDSETVD